MFQTIVCVLTLLNTATIEAGRFQTNLDNSHSRIGTARISDIREAGRAAPQQMPGWPQHMPVPASFAPSGVVLADINHDGYCEILAGTTLNAFYVWDYQGNPLTGWPKTGLEEIQTKAAVADIDTAFPGLEIIVPGRTNTLYAWHSDGTNVPGWPQTVGETSGFESAVIFDIDGDGDLEIILGQRYYPEGRVRVFHHDGTPYAGWPKVLDYMCVATPSVGDVDNDGIIEICALSFNSAYLWDKDGNNEPGWPKLNIAGGVIGGGISYAQPVLSDIDSDGYCEILVAYHTNYDDSVNIFNHDGTVCQGWPRQYPGPQSYMTPVTADIDADGDLEIFGGGHVNINSMLARHHTGAQIGGWPVDVDNVECSPIVFDLDDDGYREVLVGDNMTPGNFFAFERNGQVAVDWPVATTAAAYVNSASVADVDGDGDIEVAFLVGDGTVNLWTIDGVVLRNYLIDWGTFFHDNWNTGWVHPLPPVNLSANISADTVFLTWDANGEPDIAGYNIYRSALGGGPYDRVNATVAPGPSYWDIPGSGEYYYCVTAQIQARTESRLSNEVEAMVGVAEGSNYGVAGLSVAPNPFRNTITFSAASLQEMKVRIYDVSGAFVEELHGQGSIVWRAGGTVAQGVYFADIMNGAQRSIRKVVKLD